MTRTFEHIEPVGGIYACECGARSKNPLSRHQCGKPAAAQITDLSKLACKHLLRVTTGESPACCGGTALIDVGLCDLNRLCTTSGRKVDGNPTTNYNACGQRERP